MPSLGNEGSRSINHDLSLDWHQFVFLSHRGFHSLLKESGFVAKTPPGHEITGRRAIGVPGNKLINYRVNSVKPTGVNMLCIFARVGLREFSILLLAPDARAGLIFFNC